MTKEPTFASSFDRIINEYITIVADAGIADPPSSDRFVRTFGATEVTQDLRNANATDQVVVDGTFVYLRTNGVTKICRPGAWAKELYQEAASIRRENEIAELDGALDSAMKRKDAFEPI